jgi:uncharacterized repeat protein (TIGR01451 family)
VQQIDRQFESHPNHTLTLVFFDVLGLLRGNFSRQIAGAYTAFALYWRRLETSIFLRTQFVSRLLVLAAAFGFILTNFPAGAVEKPRHAELPNFDKRSAAGEVPAERVAAAERLKERLPRLHVDYEPVTKTPKIVVARDGFLSGPRGRGRGVAREVAESLPEGDALHPLRAFLKEHKEVIGHSEERLKEARVKRQDVAKKSGLRSYVWQQEFDGLEVVGAILTAHITKDAELASVSSGFLEDLEGAANAGTPRRRVLQFAPTISAADAVRAAAENVGETVGEMSPLTSDIESPEKRQTFRAGNLPGEAEARLVWLPLSGTALRLCWEVEVTRRAGGERFRLHVDAETGEVITRYQLTVYLADASYRVFTSDSPSPFSPGHQTPQTNQPPLVERSLVTLGALSTNASPTGWIHPGENETRGNNVDAHLDRNADDLADLPRPQGNPFRVFDFPIDFSQPPSTYGNASAVQLFYWCNWMHDTLYELGFTEAAGNFQKDNFGRGGLGNDPILADSQDGSGTDNANFTPSADGRPARIQMYTFTGPEPDRDGDFDAEIVIHEYAHGLSDRLVGGGGGLQALQSGGLGEGWSDFYALALLSESSDDPRAAYPMGGYATDNFFGLKENYYFGIRRYPYSTDLSKNPLTFKDIDPLQAIPHDGVPLSPINRFDPLFAAEVHNSGELWCVTLWEMRANLVDRYGFEGNRLALQLVTDAMKLTPRNPNFLHARDAIILADQISNGGANFNEIWRAFAKRGMGFSATSPDSATTIGIREAYDLPDALLIVPSTAFISAGAAGTEPTPNCKTYVITNHSEVAITWSATIDANWLTIAPSGGSLAPRSGATVTVCLSAAAAQLGIGSHAATITFSNATTRLVQDREVSLRIMSFTSMPFLDDFESGRLQPHWQVSGTGPFRSQVTSQNGPRGTGHLTMDNTGNGVNSRNEVTLGIDLAGYSNVVLRFWAKQFGDEPDGPPAEPFISGADFDGVAISADGIEWYEVQSLRSLFGNYAERRVDLDDAIARFGLSYNQQFRIRFNEFDNFSIPLDGIAIDDVSITGAAVRRFAVGLPDEAMEGSGTIEGSVTLGVAQPQDLVVTLSSSDASKLRVPPNLVIPAGSTQAVFTATLIDNSEIDGSQNVTVSAAAANFFGAPDTITIHDNEANGLSIKLAPARAREGDGLYRKMGIVKSDRKPTRDVQVTLTSSDASKVRVPSAITLQAGKNAAEFPLFIGDDSKLDGTRIVEIKAEVENWGQDIALLEIRDNDVPGLEVSLPLRASEGNGVLTNAGTVRLLATHATNLAVALTSSDTSELTAPAFVVVRAGEAVAQFDVGIANDDEADGVQSVSVTASAHGHGTATATMDVLDDEMPPVPYQPQPTHLSTGNAISTDLAWLGGVGEIVRNGGFETGDFTGWGIQTSGLGGFAINDGKFDPQSGDLPSPPFEGNFSVLTDQIGGGNNVLYQELFIPAEARGVTLAWTDKIRNHSTQYDVNQFFRVEIRDVADSVMDVAFTTAPGFPLTNNWTRRSFDLTAYRGQTIRIAFVEEDHQGYFNVHLDNISVWLADNGVTTFDVYLGTNATLSSENFLGNTASNRWQLPDLALSTTYYWQIVSRRGASSTAGPVWQFGTRGIGAVDRFEFGPIAPSQIVGEPFAATLTARDDINNVAAGFSAPVQLRAFRGGSNSSAIVITEIETTTNERIEFQNVSGRKIDISNWQIALYDTRSWPAPRKIVTLPTNSMVQPGSLFVLNAGGAAPGRYPLFLSGTNLAWNFAVVSNYAAVLLRDAHGEPVDFFCAAEAHAALITNPISISQLEWSGPQVPVNTNLALTYQRLGNVDTGTAIDWMIATNSLTRRNTNLTAPFAPRFPIALSPAVVSNFVDGVWSGELTFEEPASAITVIADDGHRHIGVAGMFSATPANDVALSVVDSPDVVILGDDLTYRFTVSNSGAAEASGVVLSNRLPSGVEFVSVSASQGTCMAAGSEIVCNIGQVSGQASVTVDIVVRPTQVGVVTNSAHVTRTGSDGFAANNTATAVSTVIYPVLATGVVAVNEGNTGTTNLTFVLRLNRPSRLPVSVDYRIADFSATAPEDYTPTNGTVTFPPGTTNRPVVVEVKGDQFDELFLEQFTLVLSAPVNCAIATPEVRGRINDDDPTPLLTITDATVAEPAPGGSTNVSFTVRLSAPSRLPVQVTYTTTNGTALSARDYYTEFGELQFPPGTTNRTFSVPVIGDTIFESNEVFYARLFGVVNASLGNLQGRATIIDNGFVDLDHFKWAPIASPQVAGAAFTATITARDGRDDLYTGFNGVVRIAAVSASRGTEIGAGTNRWEAPMGTFYHDSRTQTIYLADEIGAAGKINALALNVMTAPGQTMSNWTIRLKHTPLDRYSERAWENTGWTVVHRHHEAIQGVGWVTFFFDQPFDYNGTDNLLVDLSFDNSSYSTDGLCAAFTAPASRSLRFETDSAFGDPLDWSGSAPRPELSRLVPQVRLTIENFVNVEPAQVGPFANGTWTGQLTVLEPGTNIVLRALHDSGRSGESAGFRVDPALGATPAPSGIRISAVTLSGSDVRIRFASTSGGRYCVEATESLATPIWQTVADGVPGTGSLMDVIDARAAAHPQRFYRVRMLP